MALRLYATFKNVKYLFWGITCSIVNFKQKKHNELQAKNSLIVAEKMLVKRFETFDVRKVTFDELILLFNICKLSKTVEFPLSILETVDEKIFSFKFEKEVLKLEFLRDTLEFKRASIESKNLVKEHGIFSWKLWEMFISCAKQSCEDGSLNTIDVKMIIDLIENSSSKTDCRTQMLARLSVITTCTKIDPDWIINEIDIFIEKYKERDHCIPDLKFIFKKMYVSEIFHSIQESCRLNFENLKLQGKSRLIYYSIFRILDSKAVNSNSKNKVNNIKIDPFVAKSIIQSFVDSQETEDLLLRFNSFKEISFIDMAMGDILSAIKNLLNCQQIFPDQFTVKILLVIFWIRSGSIEKAIQVFKNLDIKQIQIDTISYILFDHLINLGSYEAASYFFEDSILTYDENNSTTWSIIFESFNRERYALLPDLFNFSTRFENSIQSIACFCGLIRSRILRFSHNEFCEFLRTVDIEDFLFDSSRISSLCDNRDTEIINLIDPAETLLKYVPNLLPSFSHMSVVSFLSIGYIMRILITNNESSIRGLEKLTHLVNDLSEKNDVNFDSLEFSQIRFARGLLDILSSSVNNKSGDIDFHRLFQKIKIFVINMEDFVFERNINPDTAYDQISKCSWLIERFQYCIFILKRASKSLDIRRGGGDYFTAMTSDFILIRAKVESLCDLILITVSNQLEDNDENIGSNILIDLRKSWKSSFLEIIDSCRRMMNACDSV